MSIAYAEPLVTAGPPRAGRLLDPSTLGDHMGRLCRAARALTGRREDAEDLVQDTFVKVLAKPRVLRGDDDVGYLLTVLRNTFFSQQRARSRRPAPVALPEGSALEARTTAGRPDAMVEAGEVYRAVAALPPAQRKVLLAVDLVGLSYEEAARSLGIPTGTVMSRLHRARAQVAALVGGR
jgi:RNA polymerase sigma-70 factor (ECF subfamily)